METGEIWGYRARQTDELTAVEVLRIGDNRPARVLVRFIDDSMEGRQDWVPPTRLKVPWDSRDAFIANEKRWDAIHALGVESGSAADFAADTVVRLVVPRGIAEYEMSGLAKVHDASGLAAIAGLDAFVVKRAGAPETGELVKDVEAYGRVKSLHVGRGRGMTLWEEDHDVSWLLAFSDTHATHEKRDAYQYFMSLSGRGEHLPTADDYEQLFKTYAINLIDGIAAEAADLYMEARRAPMSSVHRSYGDGRVRMLVDLIVVDELECEEGTICLTFPWEERPDVNEVLDLVARLLPADVDMNTLDHAVEFDGRALDPDQVGYTWSLFPEK